MFAVEVYAAVRRFVFIEGNSRREAARVFGLIHIGAAGFDAVKLIALARIERRPARLDLAAYPHLPKMDVKTTSAADYAVLAA